MASSTLAIFEPDKSEFMGLLVRLALSDSSPSSTAVLQSALALSSLHQHGVQGNVFRLKARALRALVISSNHGIEGPTVAQHIAASMILCHLEVCSSTGLYLLLNKHSPALQMLGMPNAVSLWFCK
jgi:Fungal specific transcription factor domain